MSPSTNDSFYTPFYELADAYKVPVVFHTGDTYDKTALVKFADPLGVDEIAVKYPKMNFVLAHMGNPWYHSAAEVIYKNDNVYADASAFIIGNAETYPPEQIDLLLIKPVNFVFNYALNPKKIMFGSDWPLVDIKPYLQAVQRAIPEKDWEDVFYNNAARVFQFDPP
ncbi:MAG: amidohydrolase family protein [Deltaproteobacteria bacterium]|nr:amidohydrolase family protein [Deltaproteobacteria bacterium]